MAIVITGASRGIGKALCLKFASQGHDIIAIARNEALLESLGKEVKDTYQVAYDFLVADLSNKEGREQACEYLKTANVEVLVNNAGIFIPGMIHNEESGTLEMMIETNLYSAYDLSRAVIPAMQEKKSGTVINICSVASTKAYPNGGSYAISKHAMLGFSKCLREEMKEYGVRVFSIMPGATYTDSWAGAGIPEERFIPVTDLAESIFAAYQLSAHSVIEEIVIRPQLGDI